MSQPIARQGRTASFANLMSLVTGGKPGARAEDEPRKEDEDEEARKARRAEEDEKRKEEDARRAEEDDRRKDEDARRAEEDGTDPEKKKDPESKADDDEETCEDDSDEDETKAAKAAGRAAEAARWSKVLGDAAVTPANIGAACVMLASTPMHSSQVLAAVKALPAATASPLPLAARKSARETLDERMAAHRPANPGSSESQPAAPAAGLAQKILVAGKKRRGEA